jgi:hypothetical protein
LRATQYLIGLCIFACFDAISSWIAFGPGERQFSGTFMFGDAATNAAIGRIAFGTGAVMDAGVTKGNYSARHPQGSPAARSLRIQAPLWPRIRFLTALTPYAWLAWR